jgi:hypothetical protein
MDGDEPASIENADLIGKLMHLDDTPCAVGNAVIIAANRDQAVVTDPALELEDRVEGEDRQRLELCLLGSKCFKDNPLGGAMQPNIGDRSQPVSELGVDILEVAEGAAEQKLSSARPS